MEDKLYQLFERVLSDELPDVWIEKNQTKELNKTKLLQLIDNQDQNWLEFCLTTIGSKLNFSSRLIRLGFSNRKISGSLLNSSK